MSVVCSVGDAGSGCLSRCFEKVFEDAQLSGVLQLSGRNLKTLPPHAHRHDLSDTVIADVSRNRLLDFPVELKQCGFLETLHLQNNCIRVVPNYIASLTSLTFLDLSFNQIQQLPVGLFKLPLEVLLVRSSRLEALPNDIEKLANTLAELDVSCNRLVTLPSQIGALYKLRVFNGRQNLLTWLPYEFCQLRLRYCDISHNRITHLEVDLRLMCTLIELCVEGNPLHFPPAKVCARGRDHIFKALEGQLKERKKVPAMAAARQRRSADDLEQRKRVMPALVPTDPGDVKYLAAEQKRPDGRTPRSRSMVPDSGYSTLNDENAKAEPQQNGRLLPMPGPSLFNCVQNDGNGGGLVDEVLLACMEKACQKDWTEAQGTFPAPCPQCETPLRCTPRSVKSEVIHSLYTKGSGPKATSLSLDSKEKANGRVQNVKDDNANVLVAMEKDSAFGGEERRTFRRLVYSKAPQSSTSSSSPSKAQRLQRRASLKTSPPAERSVESVCSMLEEKLKITLPRCEDALTELLSDGVLLCDYLNAIRPRTVTVIHLPSDNTAKVPMAKARRNLENFLTGCRRLGVQEEMLPCYDFVLHQKVELKSLTRLLDALTVMAEAKAWSVLTLRQHVMVFGFLAFFISFLLHHFNTGC